MPKVSLQFPYKSALKKDSTQRLLLTAGHIFLALNCFAFFLGALPLLGIALALICFSISSFKKDIFYTESIKFSFKRLVFAVSLIMLLYLISAQTGKPVNDLLLTLLFIQLPLSINDAIHIYSGKTGITMF